jgi:hypothetical protein
MGDKTPNLFENLSLRHWYKYLLYVAGVLLVLVVVLGSKIPQDQVISFSLWTMFLMIFVWISDDIIWAAATEDNAKSLAIAKWTIHVVFFFFWVIVAFHFL